MINDVRNCIQQMGPCDADIWCETSALIVEATQRDPTSQKRLTAAEGEAFFALQSLVGHYNETQAAATAWQQTHAGHVGPSISFADAHAKRSRTKFGKALAQALAAEQQPMELLDAPANLNDMDLALLRLEALFLRSQLRRLLERHTLGVESFPWQVPDPQVNALPDADSDDVQDALQVRY